MVILAALHEQVMPLISPKPLVYQAEYSVNAEVTGIMEHVDFLDKWKVGRVDYTLCTLSNPLAEPKQTVPHSWLVIRLLIPSNAPAAYFLLHLDPSSPYLPPTP